MFPAHATKNITIPANTRICQFRVQKEQPKIEFNVVESLGTENRGGLGSTGE
jgi:dUTP pyrophosphatase